MSASSSKPYTCLICAAPIHNTNLGIDACRACTVFYRRCLSNDKPLLCRKGTDDCFETNGNSLCRKCRFVRFSVVLEQSTRGRHHTMRTLPLESEDTNSDNEESIDSSEEFRSEEESTSFIDHRSFDLFSTRQRDAPFFDRLKKAYSMLCVVRKCGELGIVPVDEDSKLQGDGMVFYPIVQAVKAPCLRVLYGGLIQFYESVFEDFNGLSQESKNYILDRSIRLVHALDGLYRAVHHFPNEELLAPSYTSYKNYRIVGEISQRLEKSNMKDTVREMRDSFCHCVELIRSTFKRVNPTNEEFLALMGLCLWSNDASDANDEYMGIVTANRAAIMTELHKFYTNQGITDYSARLGDVLCLLECIEKNMQRAEEDITMVKLMSTLQDDVSRMNYDDRVQDVSR